MMKKVFKNVKELNQINSSEFFEHIVIENIVKKIDLSFFK